MKKLLYLFGAMALMLGMVACGDDNTEGGEQNKPNRVLDGFYIYGEAVGTQEFLAVNQMAAGSNEVNKQLREGMYEKYIWLEANKDLRLVENSAGNKIFYGAELAEVNYGYDINDPDCKNFADNPNMKILAGQMIVGESAPAMQVKETGLYHIVLDNNYVGDLDYPQIIIQRAKWGVRGGMNGWGFTEAEESVNADGSVTYTLTEQELATAGEYKWASCHGWKINLDVDGAVKAEVALGLTEGKLSNTGGNIAVTDAGLYTLTLTWKPASGAVADAFTHTQELTGTIDLPTEMYMTGDAFGAWTWGSEGIVSLTPVHSETGKFWAVRYLEGGKGIKFSSINVKDDWSKAFGSLTTNEGDFTSDKDGNAVVATSGLYTMIVDTKNAKLSILPAQIYGMGPCFNASGSSWTGEAAAFTVNEDGTASITVDKASELDKPQDAFGLRMYVPTGGDWWHSEFNVIDGKIVYRGGGSDLPGVAVSAGQTVTLNFNEGTGTIQ